MTIHCSGHFKNLRCVYRDKRVVARPARVCAAAYKALVGRGSDV